LPGKLFGYGALKQIQDMKKIIFATLGMILLVFMILNLIDHLFLKVILGSFMGVSSYILFCFVLKIEELKEIKALFFK
jgi:hypothetical protein